MTEALIEHFGDRTPERVLEIGTGSGYQAAVLAALVGQISHRRADRGAAAHGAPALSPARHDNLRSKHDDGKLGWPDEAPFDAMILTAAGEAIPQQLLDQLQPDGVLVAPVGRPARRPCCA